jgi:hypothetical protein
LAASKVLWRLHPPPRTCTDGDSFGSLPISIPHLELAYLIFEDLERPNDLLTSSVFSLEPVSSLSCPHSLFHCPLQMGHVYLPSHLLACLSICMYVCLISPILPSPFPYSLSPSHVSLDRLSAHVCPPTSSRPSFSAMSLHLRTTHMSNKHKIPLNPPK